MVDIKKLLEAYTGSAGSADGLSAIRRQLELASARTVSTAESAIDRLLKAERERRTAYDLAMGAGVRTAYDAALSPLNADAQRLISSVGDSPLLAAHSAIQGIFHLPPDSEIARLAQLTGQSAAAASLTGEMMRLMGAMRHPWLHEEQINRSLSGFAQLQTMGLLLRDNAPYGSEVTEVFRHSLGDWRDPMEVPERIYLNPEARVELYQTRGFDPDLTSFPIDAFREMTSLAGVGDGVESSDELKHNEAAYARLLRFERSMRKFIAETLYAAYGEKWMKSRIPGVMLENWKRKREDALKNNAPDGELIDFADIGDYIAIIGRRDNWDSAFRPIFKRLEDVRESLQRLMPIRHSTMHSRIITPSDEAIILYETSRVLKAIRNT